MPRPADLSLPFHLRHVLFRSGLVASLLLAILAFDAGAVIIATGDGTGNTTAPPADPGFDNVGRVGALSGVYMGNGWVLTASHVGAKPIEFLGTTYDPVPGSRVQFQNPNLTFADLIVFKLLDAKPPLPDVTLTDSAPSLGTGLTVIGNGLNRGIQLSHMGQTGWDWAVGWTTRWGTNSISNLNADATYSLSTESFAIRFDDISSPAPGQHEAALAHGDSGGAAFTGSGASAELVGILFASAATLINQPAGSSFYTNDGLIVDLFVYRSAILALIEQPGCSDGLDDDGDGLVDYPADPGCADALDTNERGPDYVCDNGIDDDGDGEADYPNDNNCLSPTGTTEAPNEVPSVSLGAGAGLLAFALYAQGQHALRRLALDADDQSMSTRSTR